MNNQRATFSTGDFITLCCAVAMGIAFVFMPWIAAFGFGSTALRLFSGVQPTIQFDTSTLILIPIAIVGGLLAGIWGLMSPHNGKQSSTIALIAGFIGLAYFGLFFIQTNEAVVDVTALLGVGFWVALFASIGMILQVFIPRSFSGSTPFGGWSDLKLDSRTLALGGFIVIAVIFILSRMGNGLSESATDLVARLIAVLLGMTVHEFAHSYVAHLMGDPTPSRLGRLTLNPFVHIHWLGFLMFVIVGFGILGTAPMTPSLMRNPRWGTLAAVAAGPLSNLLLAAIFAIVWRLLPFNLQFNNFVGTLVFTIISWNVLLFVFNLLPLFPIDGWRIVLALLPPDLAYWWQRQQQNSQFVLLGLILLSFVPLRGIPNILGLLIGEPSNAITRALLGL